MALFFGMLVSITSIVTITHVSSEAHPLNDSLAPDFTATSQPISTLIEDQTSPAIAYNSAADEYLVVWEHKISDLNQEIYARRVSSNGTPIGSEIPITTSSTFESNPDVTYNPLTNEYLVVWQYAADLSNNDLYFRRFASDGTPIGGTVPIAATANDELLPTVAAYPWADAGYLLVYQWRLYATEQHDIRGQIIGSSGALLGSFTIASGVMDQAFPDLAAGEDYLVTWQMEDLESGDDDYEIHARSVSWDGSSLGGERVLSNAPYDQVYPKTAYDSNNDRFLVIWEDHRWAWGAARDLYGQLLDGDGSLLGGNFGVAWETSNYRLVPDVGFNPGMNEYMVVYEYEFSPTSHNIYRRRVSSDGALPDAEMAISSSPFEERKPSLAARGDNSTFIVWQDDRDAEQGWNIYGSVNQLPDLTVTHIWNQGASICYQLENIGGTTAPAGHSTSLSIDGDSPLTHQVWQDLSPGNTLGSCFFDVWDCSPPGDTLGVSADYLNQVLESNEVNNSMQTTLSCDTTPPEFISGPQATNLTQNSTTITWQTDEPSDSRVQYGITSGELPLEAYDPNLVNTHIVYLNGLTPAQTYLYVAQSSDVAGNSASSKSLIFETLPPSDNSAPSITLDNPGQLTGEAVLSAIAADDTGIEKVIFYQDGEQVFTDYSAPYQYVVDTPQFDNGSHTILAQAIDLAGNQADSSNVVDFSNLKDASWPTVQITSPGQSATVSGIVPVIAQLSDDTGIVSARFFVDGDYQQFKNFYVDDTPTSATAEFDWDTRGLKNNTSYTLKVEVYDLQGKLSDHSVVVLVKNVDPPPPPSPPSLQIASQVVLRNENKFIVMVTVKNLGDFEARNIRILYGMHGFQPIAKDYDSAEIRTLFAPVTGEVYAEIHPKSSIPAKDARIYTFSAIPFLYNPDPEIPSFGFFIDMSWDSPTHSGYFDGEYLPVGTVVGGETIPEAHKISLETADYLIVTNPLRLAAVYNPSYFKGESWERTQVNKVLSKMAELAYYQNGILGYNTVYTSESLRDLIKKGGSWSNQLVTGWTTNGYMMLVGEVEVLSSWWRHFGTLEAGGQERQLTLSYTDYPFASTFDDEYRPELSIARIIGNHPRELSNALDSHIQKSKGTAGYNFEGKTHFLASGFNRGLGGGLGDIDFKSERDKVANKFVGTKELLHTPDLSVYNSGGGLNISATTHAITTTLLSSFQDQDIIFLAGHGNHSSWDALDNNDLNNASDPFGDTIPFVFASSCETATYADGSSLAEFFLWKGTGAYLGAIKHGLCPNGDCPISDLFADKWNPGISFARALRDTKYLLSWDVIDRWWNAIYQVFGDAKFGTVAGYLPSTSNDLAYSVLTPSDIVEISVPDYEITLTDYGHRVTIPDGISYSETGKPTLPAFQVIYEFPAGTQVQEVELLDRSEPELISGLNIPPTTFVIPGIVESPNHSADSSADWWPEKDFEWLINNNPLTTRLTIRMYPFVYNDHTQEGRYYDHYTFDIQTTSSSVEITQLETNENIYHPGQVVSMNLTIQSIGESPEDVVVSALIQEAASGEYVSGLLLETLDQLNGQASFSPTWDTSSFPSGDYTVLVELRNPESLLLDQLMESFQVGVRQAQVSNLVTSHQVFKPGMLLHLSIDTQNTGDVPINATVVMDIHAPDAGIIQTFPLPVNQLSPGESIRFEIDWDTTGVGPGAYYIVAYAEYGGAATDTLTLDLRTNPKIYMPLIYR